DSNKNKKPKINIKELKDSICLVGITAVGLYDINSIPLQTFYPGIGVTATILSNILKNNFIRVAPAGINTFILYLICLLPAFLILGKKPLKEILLILLTGGIYCLIHIYLFRNNTLLNLATPLLGLFASYLAIETHNLLQANKKQKQLFEMAITDGLTNLYNITYFKVTLENEIMLANQGTNKNFCVVMCDIDYFKKFNDNYGHDIGDLVLKEIAYTLKTSSRSSDIIARYGGEEMIVILKGCALQEGLKAADKIRENIENHLIKDEKNTYKITISAGVACYKTGDTPDTIIKRADTGLYKAKESGRNRVETIENL
ncbi:MAG: diguanylate cyclase, partial [Candidatus Omnitrophota bacterium]